MSDVIFTPVSDQPVKQGWALSYTDQLGQKQSLPPQNSRPDTHVNGPLPTLPNHSGLVDRFDDTQYYTT